MRHRVAGKHLSRTSAHRRALRRNLAASLFEHGTIETTRQKAKFVRPFAEKLITLAKNPSLHNRRRAIALLQNRDICKVENDEPVKTGTVIQKLFEEIGPRFAERPGGYTRIIRSPFRRIGDNGELVWLQLVDSEKLHVERSKKRKGSKAAPTTPVVKAADAAEPAEAPAAAPEATEAPASEPTETGAEPAAAPEKDADDKA